ncbi:MAG: nucleoside-triphosphatase [Desulfomonilia bacterium]|jgi:nucleoside-triphosphatase THEP1
MILVLTGEKGSGKTTLLKRLVTGQGMEVQGFLSLKEMENGRITGISLMLLPEQELVPMATTTPIPTNECTKRFYFHPGVFERINSRFRKLKPGSPFIFDEFGLLEMEGRGHYPVFLELLAASLPALVVVRSELAEGLCSLLDRASQEYRSVSLDREGPQEALRQVAEFLSRAPGG